MPGFWVDGCISVYGNDEGMEQEIPAAEGSANRHINRIGTGGVKTGLQYSQARPDLGPFHLLKIVLDNELSSKEYVICDEDTVPLILDFPIHLAKRIEVLFSLREGEMSIGLSEIMLIREEG